MPAQPYETSYTSEAIAFCQELVRTPSLPGEEGRLAELVEAEMTMLGYDEVRRDDLGNVIGIVRGERPGPTVLYDAHMDTVPVVSLPRWRYEPFGGTYAEERIWGRGALEAKGPLAAVVLALGSLPRARLAGRAVVSASVGGERMPGAALAHVLARSPADIAIICEPTGLSLGVGQKGRVGLVLLADGVPSPSSLPELGVNAVYLALEAVARLRIALWPQDELLGSGTAEVVGIASAPCPDPSGTADGGIIADAGVVPDSCTVHLDRRLVRGETRDTVLASTRRALDGLRGVEVALRRIEFRSYSGQMLAADDYYPAWVGDLGSTLVRRARRALVDAGLPSDLYLAPYTSNGVASAVDAHLPTLLYGPGDIGKAHGIDESLRVDELLAALSGYQALACALGEG